MLYQNSKIKKTVSDRQRIFFSSMSNVIKQNFIVTTDELELLFSSWRYR